MSFVTSLVGFLMLLFYAWRRLRLPLPHDLQELQTEYFWLVIFLSLQSLMMVLWIIWIHRKSSPDTLRSLGQSSWYSSLIMVLDGLGWLRKTPEVFYQKIRPHLGINWENFLLALRNWAGRKNSAHLFIVVYVLPGSLPPLMLLWSLYGGGSLKYFYYSLPLLSLRWIFLLLLHLVQDWASRQVNIRLRGGWIQGQWQPSPEWIQNYFEFLQGNAYLGLLSKILELYKIPLLFLNSLVYLLAWSSVLLSTLLDRYGYLILWIWA